MNKFLNTTSTYYSKMIAVIYLALSLNPQGVLAGEGGIGDGVVVTAAIVTDGAGAAVVVVGAAGLHENKFVSALEK